MIDVSQTIIAKSDQLNAVDLVNVPTVFKITGVNVIGDKDQPVNIELEGHAGRPYKPCLSMRRVLIAAWGADAERWIGQSMALYCDNSVKWAGKEVGGIRVSSLTGIQKPVRVPIALNKNQREMITVDILSVNEVSKDWESIATKHIDLINKSDSLESLAKAKLHLAKDWKDIPSEYQKLVSKAGEVKSAELTNV